MSQISLWLTRIVGNLSRVPAGQQRLWTTAQKKQVLVSSVWWYWHTNDEEQECFLSKVWWKLTFRVFQQRRTPRPSVRFLSLSTKTLYHSLKREKEDCSCTSADRSKASVWSWRCSSFPPSDQQVMNVTFVLYVSTKSLDMTFLFQGDYIHEL